MFRESHKKFGCVAVWQVKKDLALVLIKQLFVETVWKTSREALIHFHILSENSVKLKYFLAASGNFSELKCFDHDTALMLRPYGGLIGIDNSSLDKYLKRSKILRLHPILHDAGAFLYELLSKDLVILICFREKAATVLAGICREYYFAKI